MTDNERVEKWWLDINGYADEEICEAMGQRYVSPISKGGLQLGPIPIPKWRTVTAWTPKLFQKIEDAGLVESYCNHLRDICMNDDWCGQNEYYLEWFKLKATPAQKTSALARALQEQEV